MRTVIFLPLFSVLVQINEKFLGSTGQIVAFFRLKIGP